MKDIGFHKRNETGLTNAYKANNKIYIKGDTMFLAGTSNLQDVWDDLKIPFGLTRFSQRYHDADNLLEKNPQVQNIVGHSLSGSVSLELQKRHKNKNLPCYYLWRSCCSDGRSKIQTLQKIR